MNLKSSLAVVGVLALLGFLTWGLLAKGDGGLQVGDAVPAPDLPTLTREGGDVPDEGGPTGSLARFRGEWVLLNVWASWCDPCRSESPALEEFARDNRDRITVLGVDTKDLTDDARRFLGEYDISYPQLRDADGTYAEDLGTSGVPESFLVDPRGKLAAHLPGAFSNREHVDEFAAPAIRGARAGATGARGGMKGEAS